MTRTLCLTATAAFAVAFAMPAAAQTAWAHPNGLFKLTLPATMAAHPLGAVNADKGQFVVKRGGTDVGICIGSAMLSDPEPTQEVWSTVISTYTTNPETSERESSERSGHTFVRHIGMKPYKSIGGWDGYIYWFERINKTNGKNQVAVNAGTMLDSKYRFVAVCSSSAGYMFEPAEITAIQSFITSARRP